MAWCGFSANTDFTCFILMAIQPTLRTQSGDDGCEPTITPVSLSVFRQKQGQIPVLCQEFNNFINNKI